MRGGRNAYGVGKIAKRVVVERAKMALWKPRLFEASLPALFSWEEGIGV